MKPPGIAMGLNEFGPTLSVTRSTPAQDAIWEAVREALDAGMSVEQFRREAAEAWRVELRERARDDARAWGR